MELECGREGRERPALDLRRGGQEHGEATARLRGAPAHASPAVGVATRSCRKGLVARARPIEVCSPCPGKTTMLSANGSTLLRRLSSISEWSPPTDRKSTRLNSSH